MAVRWLLPVAILLAWMVAALGGPFMQLQGNQIDLPRILLAPSEGAWLGHDDLGRFIADRLIEGARTSFFVALFVVTLSAFAGTFIGALSAYIGGWWDHLLVRIIDVFMAFPGILLAIALAGILGPGIENVIIALSVLGWVGYARLARAQVLALKYRDHVVAAVALGTRPVRIVICHLLPLIMAPLIVEATFGVAGVVISEAGLSFLGLGVQPPEASWGSMIRDGAKYMLVAPHMVIVPGVALMLVVFAVNLLGDYLRDRLDIHQQMRACGPTFDAAEAEITEKEMCDLQKEKEMEMATSIPSTLPASAVCAAQWPQQWRQRWEGEQGDGDASAEQLLQDARHWLAEAAAVDHRHLPAVWLPLWEASASDELWHIGYQWLKNMPFDARGWSTVWWQLAAWPAPAGPAKELLARAYIRMSSDNLPHARWPRTWLVLWENSEDNKTRRALLLKIARDYLTKSCAGRGRKAVIAIVNEMERRRANRERQRAEEGQNA